MNRSKLMSRDRQVFKNHSHKYILYVSLVVNVSVKLVVALFIHNAINDTFLVTSVYFFVIIGPIQVT